MAEPGEGTAAWVRSHYLALSALTGKINPSMWPSLIIPIDQGQSCCYTPMGAIQNLAPIPTQHTLCLPRSYPENSHCSMSFYIY